MSEPKRLQYDAEFKRGCPCRRCGLISPQCRTVIGHFQQSNKMKYRFMQRHRYAAHQSKYEKPDWSYAKIPPPD